MIAAVVITGAVLVVLAWCLGFAMGLHASRDLVDRAARLRAAAERENARAREHHRAIDAQLAEMQQLTIATHRAARGQGIGDA